jgi:hypothetical protein
VLDEDPLLQQGSVALPGDRIEENRTEVVGCVFADDAIAVPPASTAAPDHFRLHKVDIACDIIL